ncbi:transmembrane protease serine 9-like [Phymastichus coffea]|uniref:transmembrane protease serine 9-like n=1 Tax=Phymastichus coffea TaxID=108790 RepID=UPI00273AD435|nr:transmembrane protease serine 9-like [Phymastichus coffea]
MEKIAILKIGTFFLLVIVYNGSNAEDDTVVIDALAAGDRIPSRQGRQIVNQRAGPCLTSKGAVGKCTTFKECYPYFKIPDLGALDGWVLGIYDTCSYTQEDGRSSFGICCADPPILPTDNQPADEVGGPLTEAASDDFPDKGQAADGGRLPAGESGGWPPPLPTHPPHHTIPPLPTHAPAVEPSKPSKLPTLPTTQRPLATTWPTKKPGGVYPTRPPVPAAPATTSSTQHVPPAFSAGACGAKNGNQAAPLDDGRIVGGVTTQQGEWPWIAGLFNAGRHICGGSLIDDTHILTAAHCVAQMNSWDVARLTVRLGDYDIKTPHEVRHVEKRVKRVVRHRGFDMRTLYNDVAILTLNEPVEFTETIRPVCLPSGANLYVGNKATVIGWGSLREGGPAPGKLQQVTIPIWSNTVCKQKYGGAAPGGIVDSFLCAGEAARDSCSGDSGGPLMVNDGRWTQVGIVSWGIGCGKGQYPGVYTRVTHFLPWIYKNLK